MAGGTLVTLEEVREARRRLDGVALRTPLLMRELDDSSRVWLKCENLQHGGAFKVRGAYHFASRLSGRKRKAGFVTFSSGNHAQGVAFAARAFGVRAVIVMPEDAPTVKVEGTRRLGAEVVQVGTEITERLTRAREVARESGATLIPPFDHRHIVAGQGTVALELFEQLGEAAAVEGARLRGRPGLVLIPIGGGGLISGCAAALRELAPACRIVGVEPEGAASMKRSLEAGEPVSLERARTVADGLKPVRPGDINFRHVRELVDEVVTVSEDALREGVLWCLDRRLVAEPSGAASVAALLSAAADPGSAADGEVIAVLSGGNIDRGLLRGWLGGHGDEAEGTVGGASR